MASTATQSDLCHVNQLVGGSMSSLKDIDAIVPSEGVLDALMLFARKTIDLVETFRLRQRDPAAFAVRADALSKSKRRRKLRRRLCRGRR
jgi:hypothetical protein